MFYFLSRHHSEKICDGGVLNITRSMKTLRIFCSEYYNAPSPPVPRPGPGTP
jgi:hypothetical protein